jgi:hypothetical protein
VAWLWPPELTAFGPPSTEQGDIVLLGMRDYQEDKVDIIHKYNADEARNLKAFGELPETGERRGLGQAILFLERASLGWGWGQTDSARMLLSLYFDLSIHPSSHPQSLAFQRKSMRQP